MDQGEKALVCKGFIVRVTHTCGLTNVPFLLIFYQAVQTSYQYCKDLNMCLYIQSKEKFYTIPLIAKISCLLFCRYSFANCSEQFD